MDWYLDLSGKIIQGIGAHTTPKIQKYLEEIEGLEGQDIGFIQIGYAFAPDPLMVESFIARGPYGNPKNYLEQIQSSTERGWLKPTEAEAYELTEKGEKMAESFLTQGNEWFSNLPSLSEAETNRIAELLAKVVENAYKTPNPAQKATLEIGIRLKPAADAPAMSRVRRHLTDLAYFRDDAHISAWQSRGVDGKVWETLTFLWRGEAKNAAELAEQVAEYRGYTTEDYAAAFEELVTRGWAVTEDGKYQITDEGKKFRQEAEDDTDQLFYTPFKHLDPEEIKELKNLLGELAEVVKAPEAEAEPA